jgi:predicted RNase H-like nuclease (RuvC/YqgF family)
MRKASPVLGLFLAAAVGLVAGGCGQAVKQENEQLKSQIATLQKENTDLKGQVTTLKADTDALKKQLEDLSKERQALEDQLKEAEARAAAKPGTKPPLRRKKSS